MAKTDCKPLPPISDKDIARFWSKVDKSPGQGPKGECWQWAGGANGQGYGLFSVNRRMHLSTRIAYFLATGHDPYPLLVCHTCDNPLCVNGAHLFCGTQADNLFDMTSKGRRPYGKDVGWMTTHQVAGVRSLWETGLYRQKQLAVMFGASQSHISQIVTGQQRNLK